MKVISHKYPNVQLSLEDKVYIFKDGYCDLPDHLAMDLCQRDPNYSIDKESVGPFLPFDADTWRDKKKIIWDGPVGYDNGYGKASMMFIEGLDTHADVYVVNGKWAANSMDHLGKNLTKIMKKDLGKLDSYYIKFFPGWEFTQRVAERYVGYTMLEATRIPQSWVDKINANVERVVVPCTHQKQAFIDSGVKRAVDVVPLGIIPEMFPYIDRDSMRDDSLFYFGTMGMLTYRKGTDLLVKAFVEGLPQKDYPDARLYIKTLPMGGVGSAWFMSHDQYTKDGRIEIIAESMSPHDLVHEFFAKMDCFVFPTRGEGFGLPPLEAMATGLPVIATNWSGTGDYMDDEYSYSIDYDIVDVPNGTPGGYPEDLQAENQQWAEPKLDHLVAQMRHAYHNREEAKEKGRKASIMAKSKYDINVVSKQLVDLLDAKL